MLFTSAVCIILYGIAGTASEMTTVSMVLTDVSGSKTGSGTSRCKLSQCLGLFSLWFRAIMNQARILGKNRSIQPLLRATGHFSTDLWLLPESARIQSRGKVLCSWYLGKMTQWEHILECRQVSERMEKFYFVLNLHKQLKHWNAAESQCY